MVQVASIVVYHAAFPVILSMYYKSVPKAKSSVPKIRAKAHRRPSVAVTIAAGVVRRNCSMIRVTIL